MGKAFGWLFPAVSAISYGVLGNFATDAIRSNVMNETWRDIGIVTFWLGLLVVGGLIVWRVPWARLIPVDHSAVHTTIPVSLSSVGRDAIEKVLVGQPHQFALDVNFQDNGWPIMYPILVRNTRPTGIELLAFNVQVFGDDIRWHGFHWSVLDGPSASNGGRVIIQDRKSNFNPSEKGKVDIPGDDYRVIQIPIFVSQIQPKPVQAPAIRVTGQLRLGCEGENPVDIDIPDYGFRPRLDQGTWDKLVKHVQQ